VFKTVLYHSPIKNTLEIKGLQYVKMILSVKAKPRAAACPVNASYSSNWPIKIIFQMPTMPNPVIFYAPARGSWLGFIIAFCFLKTCLVALAQDESTASASLEQDAANLQLGPLHLHPRATAGVTYDDNIEFSPQDQKADFIWSIQPGIQAVVGDDANLVTYRDMHYDVLKLSPGDLIVQPLENWPGKLMILDYAPNFKFYDQNTEYNFVDQYANANLIWAMSKLILGFNQNYMLEKTTLIQVGQIATTQTIHSKLTAAYLLSDKTSLEGNFNFIDISYDLPGLIGYKEYNTEDWFNYIFVENLPISVGFLGGLDDVVDGQNQAYEQLRARARYNYSALLNFDASLGGELRQYENGHAQTISPVFSVSGNYRPTERTTVSLTGSRQQSASILNGSYSSTTGVFLGLQQGITDRFTVDANVGYYFSYYTPIDSIQSTYTENFYAAGLGLEAKIIRHLTSKISYQWQNRESEHAGNVNDNQINAQLTLSY
jgi:hypothetical protein